MSVIDAIESNMIDVSHEPLGRVMESDDTWLTRAVQRIQAEAATADPTAAVARFNSAP